MARWTNLECRKLIQVHNNAVYPTRAELAEMFPRHTVKSILVTANNLGIKRKAQRIHWLRVAHLHFAKREAESRSSSPEGGILEIFEHKLAVGESQQ